MHVIAVYSLNSYITEVKQGMTMGDLQQRKLTRRNHATTYNESVTNYGDTEHCHETIKQAAIGGGMITD